MQLIGNQNQYTKIKINIETTLEKCPHIPFIE